MTKHISHLSRRQALGALGGGAVALTAVAANAQSTAVEPLSTITTPRREFGFAGLDPGDHWCLCAARFLQAHDEGCAPQVNLAATHQKALEIVPLEVLRAHAAAS